MPLFYLSHKKSPVSRVAPSHWEKESAHGGGTREDRSTNYFFQHWKIVDGTKWKCMKSESIASGFLLKSPHIWEEIKKLLGLNMSLLGSNQLSSIVLLPWLNLIDPKGAPFWKPGRLGESFLNCVQCKMQIGVIKSWRFPAAAAELEVPPLNIAFSCLEF